MVLVSSETHRVYHEILTPNLCIKNKNSLSFATTWLNFHIQLQNNYIQIQKDDTIIDTAVR